MADTIEQNMSTVAERLGIQVRSAWRYFDAAALADRLAQSARDFQDSGDPEQVGQAPLPPLDNPELALILASVPDALARTGGDLYTVILNVAVNAWMAGHIHGEDGCDGCEGSRGPGGARLGGPHAHDHRDAAEHHQVVRPGRMDRRAQRQRVHRHPPLTSGRSPSNIQNSPATAGHLETTEPGTGLRALAARPVGALERHKCTASAWIGWDVSEARRWAIRRTVIKSRWGSDGAASTDRRQGPGVAGRVYARLA